MVFPQQKTTLELKYKIQHLPFGLKQKKSVYTPDVSLVLSGGGSRGLSQIGVLKAFEENNIDFNTIVGTSMGSIIGGLYSVGYSIDELEKVGRSSEWKSFSRTDKTDRSELFVEQKIAEDKAFLTLRLDGLKPVIPNSLNTGKKIGAFLNSLVFKSPLLVERNFVRFLYNYKAVATNLIKGEAVIIKKGSLVKAMRASSSVSLLLPPVRLDSLLLADGGLVSNIPVEIAKQEKPDFIIAVDATSPLRTEKELKLPWNVADQIVSIPILVNNKKNRNQADFVISPDLGKQNGMDFKNQQELIRKGYQAAIEQIPALKKKIRKKSFELIGGKDGKKLSIRFPENLKPEEYLLKQNLKKYAFVTTNILLYEISEIYKTGDYEDIKIIFENNFLNLKVKYNPIVKNINLIGCSDKFYAKASDIMLKLSDKPFNSKKTVNKLIQVLKVYRNSNHSLSEVTGVDFNKTTGELKVNIEEGVIDKIIVIGNNKTNETIITREIPLMTGDIFNAKKLSQGLANLQSSNLFDEVELTIRQIKGKNCLVVKVEEKITGVARFGLRIDNEYATQIAVDLRDENVLGSGTELGATFKSGLKNHSIILEHKSNRIFDTYLTYKIQGYYRLKETKVYGDRKNKKGENERNEVARYNKSFFGVSVGVGTQVERFGNILMRISYERNKISNVQNFKNRQTSFNLFLFNFLVHIDSQNQYPFPIKGFKIKTEYESALSFFDSEISYTKFLFNYKGYFPLVENHTLFTRLKVGFGDRTMPFSKHFSFGGQQNFYGFRENEYVGRQIFVSSLGYRYKLPVKLIVDTYLKLRYDIGSVWKEKDDLRFKDMKHGIGISLALETPIGPAEFSYGHSFTFKDGLFNKGVIPGDSYFYFTVGYYY